MADGTVNVTNHATHLATMIASEALLALPAYFVATGFTTKRFSLEIGEKGQGVRVPILGDLTVQEKTAGTPITPQQPGENGYKYIELDHEEYVDFIIEDFLKAVQSTDYLRGYTNTGFNALATKIETRVMNLAVGLQTVGSAGSETNYETILDGREALINAKIPPQFFNMPNGVNLIVSPKDEKAMLLDPVISRAINTGNWQSEGAIKTGLITKVAGVWIYVSQLVKTSGANPITYHNLLMGPDSLGVVTKALPEPPAGMGVVSSLVSMPLNPSDKTAGADAGIVFRVTLNFDPNYKGVRCSLGVLYGVGTLREEMGVDVNS